MTTEKKTAAQLVTELHELADFAISDAELAAHDQSGPLEREAATESRKSMHAAIDQFAALKAREVTDADVQIVGYMVHGDDCETAALYPLSQTANAFDASRRWGRSISALVAHPCSPTLPCGKAREVTDAEIDALPEHTPMDRFENAIREVGVVAACEWFGHSADSKFTKLTIRVLDERAAIALANKKG